MVYIGTTHPFHHTHSILALQAGKHVLCEKPFAMNQHEAKEMITVAREQGRFLMEAMWTRFFPAYKQAKIWIENGEIGQITGGMGDFGFLCPRDNGRMWNPESGGGGLLDIGIYPLSFMVDVVGQGQYPDAISALGSLSAPQNGVDVSASVTLKYQDKLCQFFYTLDANTPEEWTLLGTEGRIRFSGPAHTPTRVTLTRSSGRGESKDEVLNFPLPGIYIYIYKYVYVFHVCV